MVNLHPIGITVKGGDQVGGSGMAGRPGDQGDQGDQ